MDNLQLTDQKQLDNHQLVQTILRDFIPVMDSWIDNQDRMPDPFETEYSENYAPATGAAVYAGASLYIQDSHALSQCVRMIRRSIVSLEDRSNGPFQRVFIFHYCLLALTLLPQAQRSELFDEFQPFFASYHDDCIRHTTNCAALQWASEILLVELDYRPADMEVLRRSMVIIEKGQSAKGFINDAIDPDGTEHDGMPVAYHYFMLFIMLCASNRFDRSRKEHDLELLLQLEKADAIIAIGLQWMMASRAPDGTFAMGERSGYQVFTWGVLSALSVYAGLKDELVRETVQSWLPYKQADGSYSCTPNHFPPALRIGYEEYSHINMYDTLGMVGLVLAERLLENKKSAASYETDGSTAISAASQKTFVDPFSGYVFVHRGNSFFASSMRMHQRGYMPAMQGFHFRLNGAKIPLSEQGCWEWNTASDPFKQTSAWEGYLLQEENGQWHIPNSQENANVDELEHGILLQEAKPEYHCEKRLEITEQSVRWSFEMKFAKRFTTCQHVLPLLVNDGLHQATFLQKAANLLEMRFGNVYYELSCDKATNLTLSLNRSLRSPSGVTALLCLDIASSIEEGDTVKWMTEFRICD